MASNPNPDQTLTETLAGPVPDSLAAILAGPGGPRPTPTPTPRPVAKATAADADAERARERLAIIEALTGRRIDQLDEPLSPVPPVSAQAATQPPPAEEAKAPAGQGVPGDPPAASLSAPAGAGNDSAAPAAVGNQPDPLAAERQKLAQAEAELARERQKIEEERARLRAEVADIQIEVGKVDATAADYDRWAGEFERDGDDNLAQAARERAAGLREKGKAVQARVRQARSEKERLEHDREAVRAHPELQDTKSDFSMAVLQILKGAPALAQMPNGLRLAAEHVAVSRRAQDADALRTRLADTEKRLAEREKLLQPGIGAPPGASGPANFDSLPLQAQRDALRRELRAAEEQGARLF